MLLRSCSNVRRRTFDADRQDKRQGYSLGKKGTAGRGHVIFSRDY